MKLTSLILGVKSLQESTDYYTHQLGMDVIDHIQVDNFATTAFRFPNSENTASLELSCAIENGNSSESYEEAPTDNYWKYSLFVDDIERTYQALDPKYLAGKPYQFKDIGYLLHTSDPNNYNIEFIQKYFKENTQPTDSQDTLPLKESPVFGLITLRTKDPVQSIKFYENFFGLKFIERMNVAREDGTGFSLYFLGPEHLQPPNLADPDAIENREWLYHQEETFIELQYHWGTEHRTDFHYIDKSDRVLGLKGVVFATNHLEKTYTTLSHAGLSVTKTVEAVYQKPILTLQSPDQHPIVIRQV
ncbi:MAG: VOC family protein [Chloroflexota bacterium]